MKMITKKLGELRGISMDKHPKQTLFQILNHLKEKVKDELILVAEMLRQSRENNQPPPENFGQVVEIKLESILTTTSTQFGWTKEVLNEALEQHADDIQVHEIWNWWMSNKKKAVDLEVEPIVKTLLESVNPIAIYNLKKESAIRFLIALYEEIQA